MTDNEVIVWGIHAGRTGDANSLFLNKNVVGLGWKEIGDLSGLKPDREVFKTLYGKTYPEEKPGSIPVNAGQLFRFIYEMKTGDYVVYPSQRDRQIYIGQIEGQYQYSPKLDNSYPNTRPVKWLKTFPRTTFSQGA